MRTGRQRREAYTCRPTWLAPARIFSAELDEVSERDELPPLPQPHSVRCKDPAGTPLMYELQMHSTAPEGCRLHLGLPATLELGQLTS
jgi:hypothetical protein